MNPTNNNDQQFDKLSPVLELMYLMVTNMQKYLKVYAEDTSLENLQEYKDVYKALEHTKSVMDKVYGLDEGPEEVSQPEIRQNTQQVQQAPSVENSPMPNMQNDFEAARESLNQVRQDVQSDPVQRPQAPVMPSYEPPMRSVPTQQSSGFSLPAEPPMQSMNAAPVEQSLPPMPQQQAPQDQVPQGQQAQAGSSSTEIDSILAELRKLQSNQNPQQ